MSLSFSITDVIVGVENAQLISFRVKKLHSLLIYATGAFEISSGGAGLPRAAAESFGMSHLDFDMSKVHESEYMTIYAKAGVATSAKVVLIQDV